MLLKRILGTSNTYDRKYGVAFLVDFILLFAAAVLIGTFIEKDISAPFFTPLKSALYAIIATYLLRELFQAVNIELLLRRRSYISQPATYIDTKIYKSAVNDELDKVDEARLIEEKRFWKLYDATFNFYRKTKHGRYKSKQAYYTVFEAKLQRTVPHLIFDSKKAKNRQFRYIYLQSQRLSLEGDFDDHFEAYAPQYYQIDALSFITPEVMWAMTEMKGYDVEFIEDSLLCYGPLLSKKELSTFKQKCLHLHKNVNDNLSTYRDNRLQGNSRIHDVTSFGKKLLNNPARYVPMLILSGIGSGVVVYLSVKYSWELLTDRISLIVLFLFGNSITQIVKTVRLNNKLESDFKATHGV